jgi:hypothetical protein
METFFGGNLKNFWGFESQCNFDKSFLWDFFSWALERGWVVLESGSENLFRRETQNSIFRSLWATRNRKLMRKIELVQGWPKNGAQIRKSQKYTPDQVLPVK